MKTSYQQLIDNNRAWVEQKLSQDPNFFTNLAKGQKPPVLWIGCADSRVPANEITGTQPGEVFVHRNIANMVVHTDMNMLSVLDYAVNVLEVKHVIVCGHYGCGGILAAMEDKEYGLIDNWIRHIRDVYKLHKNELEKEADPEARAKRFVELNAVEQMLDLSESSIIRNAFRRKQNLALHAWAYDIKVGLVKELGSVFSDRTEILIDFPSQETSK